MAAFIAGMATGGSIVWWVAVWIYFSDMEKAMDSLRRSSDLNERFAEELAKERAKNRDDADWWKGE